MSPVEPGDLRRQSMPLSYVTLTVPSTDGAAHRVRLYADISGEWVENNTSTPITWDESAYRADGAKLISLTCTPASPKPLAEDGDLAAWGTVVWSTAHIAGTSWQIGEDAIVRARFVGGQALADTVDPDKPRAINDRWPVFAHAVDLGSVSGPSRPFTLSIGHVRTPAVSYLGTPLPPLWSEYSSWQDLVGAFHADYRAAARRAAALDSRIDRDATGPVARSTPRCAHWPCVRRTQARNSSAATARRGRS